MTEGRAKGDRKYEVRKIQSMLSAEIIRDIKMILSVEVIKRGWAQRHGRREGEVQCRIRSEGGFCRRPGWNR